MNFKPIIIIITILYFLVYLITIKYLVKYKVKIYDLDKKSNSYHIYNPSIVLNPKNKDVVYAFRLQNKKDWMSDIEIISKDLNLIIKSDYNIEDPRIFTHNNELFIYLTVTKKFLMFDISSSFFNKKSMLGLIKISDCQNEKKINPKIIECDFPLNKQEKNWMLIQSNNQNYFVYSINPYKLLKFDINSNKCNIVYEKTFENLPMNLRGGTQFIPFDKYFVGIVHTRFYEKYYHNFIFLKSKYPFEVVAISDNFVIEKNHICFIKKYIVLYFIRRFKLLSYIQFISGMIYDDKNDKFIITYGESDRHSKKIEISPKIILENLVYL